MKTSKIKVRISIDALEEVNGRKRCKKKWLSLLMTDYNF
jgi:hypothetical protein